MRERGRGRRRIAKTSEKIIKGTKSLEVLDQPKYTMYDSLQQTGLANGLL
jgi:hypothetical protein